MKGIVLKPFPWSPPGPRFGLESEYLRPDDKRDFQSDIVPGLVSEGFIALVDDAPADGKTITMDPPAPPALPEGVIIPALPVVPDPALQITPAPQLGDTSSPVDGGPIVEDKRAMVEIPAGWRDLTWQKARSLASELSDQPIKNSRDAEAAITAELDRRASAVKDGSQP